ncbi:hypothetical protein BC835DRAFT_1385682 [Cytidiella melzeri]|nr:hypothetical protein BC835DRAFT_1385682 [Cytidiella melzeri]
MVPSDSSPSSMSRDSREDRLASPVGSAIVDGRCSTQKKNSYFLRSLPVCLEDTDLHLDIQPSVEAFLNSRGSVSCSRRSTASSSDPSNSTGSISSSLNELHEAMNTCDKPLYYSLESRAAQIEFSKHLERLLLAVLGDCGHRTDSPVLFALRSPIHDTQRDSLYAAKPADFRCSPCQSTSCADEESSVPPKHDHSETQLRRRTESASPHVAPISEALSPSAFAPWFIYVDVDEYHDNLQLCDDSSSSSETSNDSMPSSQMLQSPSPSAPFCHPSSSYPLTIHTPPFATAVCVPPAPKKSLHHILIPDSSPSRPTQLDHRVGSETGSAADELTPNDDYMRVKSSSQTFEIKKSAFSCVTPPQTDAVYGDEPHTKKQKLSSAQADTVYELKPRTLASRFLANEPASLRRAASLRSEASVIVLGEDPIDPDVPTTTKLDEDAARDCAFGLTNLNNFRDLQTHTSDTAPASQDTVTCPPTELSSPVPRVQRDNVAFSHSPSPLVAPPAFELIPRAPLTSVEAAETRITTLLAKDKEERKADGLSNASTPVLQHNEDQDMENVHSSSPRIKSEEREPRLRPSVSATQDQHEDQALQLGIQESFRMKVVQWMLDVMPPTSRTKPQLCLNLRAQLLESPDTRWHAAHLFTRYFLRIGTSPACSPPIADESCGNGDADDDESSQVLHGKEALTWDMAVACMAIAVKFHRDVLPPLYPVTAGDFLVLAPHTMEYDDLESAQRDLLSALSFCVGSNTPGAYLEEFWNALPSLRALVESRGHWQVAKIETWELLYDTVLDSAYLHYPTHILTGCALVLGVAESLVLTMKADMAEKLKKLARGLAPRTRRREAECTCAKLQKRARKAVKNIELDICELLGVQEELWNKCLRWLEVVAEN